MAETRRPRLAVWKFASCDGCQLSLLDCEDELLAVAGAVEIAYFPEASSAMAKGPYDLSLVEGSITTAHDAERIHKVRRQSKFLVTIGACATAGGIQALRNFADVQGLRRRGLCLAAVYQDAGDLDADLRPREGGFRAARLPDQQGAVAGGDLGLPGRPQAGDRQPQRLRRMQAARQRLRHGAGHALPRPGHACRLRRDLPGVSTAAAMAASARWSGRTPRRWPPNGSELGATPRDMQRVFRTFNAAAEPFRKESDAHGD